jgi:putative ABC transport system permease protein
MLARDPQVQAASPVLEVSTYALSPTADPSGRPQRVLLRILGIDALQVAAISPDLFPLPTPNAPRMVIFAPNQVFLNAAARVALPGDDIALQRGLQLQKVQVAGDVRAPGAPLAVMDIGAAQAFFDKPQHLSRVDLRLRPGVDREAFVLRLQARADWPTQARLATPGEATQRIDNLSRAYRVNLTVLAMVALFTGGFLVFSVLALSVTRRAQQFALLGVLGLTPRQRLQLVLTEAALLGLVGSLAGLALGTALASTALQVLGGDLGGGYFSGNAPALEWSPAAAALFGALGVAATLAGAWWPATLAQRLPPAQTLKSLGLHYAHHSHAWLGTGAIVLAAGLAFLPPVWNMPLPAYLSIAFLLLGGIAVLPWLVGWLLNLLAPLVRRKTLPLLAVERARRVRETAAIAVSGVVASLSLAVALTVMVASFRHSILQWLDTVLPAALYVRTAGASSANELAYFDPAFVARAARLPGVARLTTQRTVMMSFDPAKPAVALLARPLRLSADAPLNLPLKGDALPVPPGSIGIYVSEAMVDLYGAKIGSTFPALSRHFMPLAPADKAQAAPFFIAGIWRDYARQFGTIAMDQADFARLSSDSRVNDLALWLDEGVQASEVQKALYDLANALANTPGGEAASLIEMGSANDIRATTLRIFDRSFAVTYWLQAVAIGIGLFGVAASFSAQVLARRKEFGLLAHLGLTRRQVLRVVALEGCTWTTLGALAGLGLGLLVSLVLVHVVNPQSFHWSMEMALPWDRLSALCAVVILVGTLTAWLAGRAAAGKDAVLTVKEDW